ncbi:terminase small subunit [Brevundimonas phage vB_BpoS-Gurke]|uniref:Terminase small subunit n=1 Tax=Brevundimonas phage vB_BpoS-Gurke TaxID=2948599 RepID=A0A9E7N285_9CAUD|nr:terminase small subunit [Brevundimonas phage vB_BpoS-Gurke]
MPRLSNDRNELYAKHRARGMKPAQAAQAAGYAPGTSTTHLEQDETIKLRIAELFEDYQAQRESQRVAAREAAKVVGTITGASRAWVISQLAENAILAAKAELFKESNAALELIGKDLGMFQGGSDGDEGGGVPQTLDLDKMDALLGAAMDALPAAERTEADLSRDFTHETAMELIAGQVRSPPAPNLAKARELSTGSETDVALGADLPDLDEAMGVLDQLDDDAGVPE